MNFIKTNKPVSEPRISEVERNLQMKFPPEYRAFLIETNGGEPEKSCFYYRSGPYSDSCLREFFGIDAGMEDLEKWFLVYKTESRIPPHTIPIASDYADNLILVSGSAEDAGSIYFWNHSMETVPAEPFQNVYFLANTLAEFILMLVDEESLHLPAVAPQPPNKPQEGKWRNLELPL